MTTTQPTASILKTATLTPKKHIRTALQNSSDARSTITTFQRNNSLHTMFANAFGTKPIHEKDDSNKVEPLDPSPVLEFLSHLNVTRHDVHSRVAAALRTAIEDEIQRMPLSSHPTSGDVGSNAPLLNLLKSVWQYRDIPELRPILVCLLKRLGDHTPLQILRRLGVKKTTENEGTKKNGELKNAELLSLLGPHMSRLVWEANWDERLEAVTAGYAGQKAQFVKPSLLEAELTLSGPTILADLINPSVQNYLGDLILVQSADKCFVAATTSERRFNTKLRRTKAIDPSHVSTSVVGALASIGVTKASEESGEKSPIKEEKSIRASAEAISFIMDIIGSRPKLLGAVLDMLISEFAQTGGRLNRIATLNSDEKQQAPASTVISLLGGAANLCCSLASDVLLTFGQLPRQYEMLGIMARILDDSVQAGSISDIAAAQVQGCLRSIFRPENTAEQQAATSPPRSTEPGSSSLKIKLKAPSMFPDSVPADDSHHEKKVIQRIVKAAIASLKTHDHQGLFLNPVTDNIAPGYSLVIEEPMCIRTMEEKMMASRYKTLNEFKHDTLLMFKNCVTYNVGPNGEWFRNEATRQKNLWQQTVYPNAKKNFKAALDKRKKVLKQAKTADQSTAGSKKRPPPPLAFGLSNKPVNTGPSDGAASKEIKDDAVINKLTAVDVDPLPPWTKRRKTENDLSIPNMQCLASMLLADPFVMRILLDKIIRMIRLDVKGKSLHPSILLPSMIQMINIAKISVQLCAVKGKKYSIPDAGITLLNGTEESVSYKSIRRFLPLFSKMLLDVEIDKRMATNGDLHDISRAGLLTHPVLLKTEWEGSSSQHDMKVIVEGVFVHLLLPGNTNEIAIRHQFPRFVAALDALSAGDMLHERPFYASLTTTLMRYKAKLPHSIRDLVTGCLLRWLRMSNVTSSMERLCSCLHEALINLLNEWSARGNLVLPRDIFLTIAEEAVSASDGKELGQKSDLFVKTWKEENPNFLRVKEQYEKMLSTTPDAKAVAWREKVGIEELN